MARRRLAFMKKVSLAGIADGWTEDCYAYVLPATYADFDQLSKLDFATMTQGDQIKYEMDFVVEHFVSGQVMALDDNNLMQLVDMEAEDIRASMQLADTLYREIVGLNADPKGSSTSSTTPTSDSPTTSDATTPGSDDERAA